MGQHCVERLLVGLEDRLGQVEFHILVHDLVDIDHFHDLCWVGRSGQGEMMNSFRGGDPILDQKYHYQVFDRLMEDPKRFLKVPAELLQNSKNEICHWETNCSAKIVVGSLEKFDWLKQPKSGGFGDHRLATQYRLPWRR